MVLQYLDCAARRESIAMFAQATERASAKRPLARIAFEWNRSRSEVRLTLTSWPGGSTRLLAVCHPYGDWIDWRM